MKTVKHKHIAIGKSQKVKILVKGKRTKSASLKKIIVSKPHVNEQLLLKIAEGLKGKNLFPEQTEKARNFIANAKFEL
jgi:hypothetical protein